MLKRCTQSRSVCRSMPPIFAASDRLIPSRTAAIDSNRRLWFASFDDAASRRSSEDVYPSLIVIPFDTARSLHAILNYVSAPLGIPATNERS